MKPFDNSYIDEEYIKYLAGIGNETERNYIQCRIISQIKWYDKKSIRSRKSYNICMTFIIVLNALIPIFTLSTSIIGDIAQKIIITLLSSTVTAITAYIALQNFKDLWVHYRTNCEVLKSNLHSYFTKTGVYSGDSVDSFCALVQSCESYMIQDRSTWSNVVTSCKIDNQSSTSS